MNVWFVCPAWGRFAVTRLALAQRRHLCDELAPRGISANCVVIADDQNLELAEEFGFDTIEMDNTYLGAKLNMGFQYAADQGADYLAFVGSDDWMHADLFDPLLDEQGIPPIVSGRVLTIVDLARLQLRSVGTRSRRGVIPWLIPRWALEALHFQPLPHNCNRGLDLNLALGIGSHVDWIYHDPHPLARVDFKSDVNMTPYHGYTAERPMDVLAEKYPEELVALVLKTHETLEAQSFSEFYVREYA